MASGHSVSAVLLLSRCLARSDLLPAAPAAVGEVFLGVSHVSQGAMKLPVVPGAAGQALRASDIATTCHEVVARVGQIAVTFSDAMKLGPEDGSRIAVLAALLAVDHVQFLDAIARALCWSKRTKGHLCMGEPGAGQAHLQADVESQIELASSLLACGAYTSMEHPGLAGHPFRLRLERHRIAFDALQHAGQSLDEDLVGECEGGVYLTRAGLTIAALVVTWLSLGAVPD